MWVCKTKVNAPIVTKYLLNRIKYEEIVTIVKARAQVSVDNQPKE
jgi:hypothetical protein